MLPIHKPEIQSCSACLENCTAGVLSATFKVFVVCHHSYSKAPWCMQLITERVKSSSERKTPILVQK